MDEEDITLAALMASLVSQPTEELNAECLLEQDHETADTVTPDEQYPGIDETQHEAIRAEYNKNPSRYGL